VLILEVLNSDATLNDFRSLSTHRFYNGEDSVVVLRLKKYDTNLRYIPDAGATFSVSLLKSDGTSLVKIPTNPFADDRSIIEFSITAAESEELISQDIVVSMVEGAATKKAVAKVGLTKNLGSC
jgi:hypothetical protein